MAEFISIIVPAYNEQGNIRLFVETLSATLQDETEYEILFIDDGSSDETLTVLKEEAEKDSRVKAVSFSRNFGKESAVTCGLQHAGGDAVIIMDADLQHPPDVIPYMLQKWREGMDMVVPLNLKRVEASPLYKLGAESFYRLISAIGQVNLPVGGSDFRLISRPVVDVICALPERNRFMKAIYMFPGFDVHTFPYEVQQRHSGVSKWNYWKLWNFALDGLFGFSSMPLKIWMYVGFFLSVCSVGHAFYIGVDALINGVHVVKGVTTVAVFLFFLMGLLMMSIGVLGEYVARIYDEVKQRPLYVVKEKIGQVHTPGSGSEAGNGNCRVWDER